MKVSLRWMQQYANGSPALDGSIDELAQKIGAQLGAIEEIENLGEKYQGIIVARIVSLKDHGDSDHLHIVMIDDGGAAQNVERDANNHVQVVCGAGNLYEGMLVPWLPPGAVVPESVDKEPFVLEARDLRGIKSNGMLASARELRLGTDHSGIVEIDIEAKPGDDFAKVYKLDDYVIDIENKMFTHRPDCFGQLGVAREIAGIQQQAFKSPDWYQLRPQLPQPQGESLKLVVQNELPNLVPRLTTLVMSGVTIKPSPLWLQTYLLRVGVRPISNVVDLTNYYMLLTGQPLHAYDYDKVKAHSNGEATLAVRYPRPGEKLKLLNGKEIEPRAEAIMIATDKELIGLGGVMGGGDTEVDDSTKNIILECATFDMFSIRRTAMAHGLFTDAVTRFNKGQSPLQNLAVLAKVAVDMSEYAGARPAGEVYDGNQLGDRVSVHPPVPVTAEFINARLGLKLSATEMTQLLENVEFTVVVENDQLTVTAPFWRTDIEQREDVVEEVGRLYGYDHLPLDLPMRSVAPVDKDELLELKSRIREKLVKSGANEVLTYSFVHGNVLDKAGQDKTKAFQVSNALSPDLQYYRMSLTPSLLDRIHQNVKAGYDEFALFEIGKAHLIDQLTDDEHVPAETLNVACVYASRQTVGAPYFQARTLLMSLLWGIGVKDAVDFEPLEQGDLQNNPWLEQMIRPYEPARSALIIDTGSGQVCGVVGEYKAAVQSAFKLPKGSAGFEIDPRIAMAYKATTYYNPLPKFPKVTQDITLRVGSDVHYAALQELVENTPFTTGLNVGVWDLKLIDIYQPKDASTTNYTFRFSVASYERTLTDAEVSRMLDTLAATAKDSLNAERI